ncbi:hypothetical protein GF359_08645 [candidate division WOR-3 bacterium]|uniref:4-vinyl reductase 4VR domain-containing protein n=1 Tax=candidate division WOR-3 bacterium TaxID=2052148 RepID=A0A9D5KA29_UNCW3|nr:hypothetical protein [candidate division WOR-3 bacterium]MBD3365268.1 hypothetical protein [candidate division WOR-3 bacterium]
MGQERARDRGIFPRYTRLWLLERFGREGLNRVLNRISPQARAMLEKPVPQNWYPAEYMAEIYEAIEAEPESGGQKLLHDLGAFMAKRSMSGFLKYMVRLASVKQVINRLERIWLRYHDRGNAKGSITGKKGERYLGILSIEGYDAGPLWCKLMEGFIKAFLTQTGVRRVKTVEKTCLHKGDESCSWEISWKE